MTLEIVRLQKNKTGLKKIYCFRTLLKLTKIITTTILRNSVQSNMHRQVLNIPLHRMKQKIRREGRRKEEGEEEEAAAKFKLKNKS